MEEKKWSAAPNLLNCIFPKHSQPERATVSQRKRNKDTLQEVPMKSDCKHKPKADFHVYKV